MQIIKEIPVDKNRLKTPVSLVKGAKNNEILGYSTVGQIFKRIKEGDSDFITLSKQLREFKDKDQVKYQKLKESSCEGFIIGKYEKRSDKSCQLYCPLIGFDVDGIETDLLDFYLAELSKSDFVFAAFPSPSYKGLRILVWCDTTPENHKTTYQQVCDYLSELLDLPTDRQLRTQKKRIKGVPHLDTGTNNISRLWFFSHVEEDLFYLNENSQVFIPSIDEKPVVKLKTKERPPHTNQNILTSGQKIKHCIDKVSRQNIPAGRNNYVFSLACELCRHGVEQNEALTECLKYQEGDFNESEVKKTVVSAYQQKTFGEFTDKQIIKYLNKGKPPNGHQKVATTSPKIEVKNDGAKNVRKNKFQQIEEYLFGKYEFRKNIISIEIEYREKEGKEWKELNENDIIIELMRSGFSGVEGPTIALLKSSLVPQYDPIKNYFDNLPEWDESKPDYIKQLSSYVQAKDQHWFNTQFKKMLVRSAACVLNIIPFNKQCFTLVGEQNDGKTSFLRFICPPPLKPYFKENLDIQNKDGRIALCTNMFINLDELANFSKYEVTKTKAFFTIDHVKERLPYERKAATFPRRANFLASTNTSEFLTDETGNVRWLVFEIIGVNHDNGGEKGYSQNIDIDNVWAQVNYLLKNGFNFKLAPSEISKSERNNKSHQIATTEQELIQDRFLPASKESHDRFIMTTEILAELQQEYPKLKITDRNIGRALKFLGFKKVQASVKRRGINVQRKGYFVRIIQSK